jgi:nitrate reductase gamma subunit
MNFIKTIFQILLWTVAVWVFIGLLGSLRWLAPSAVPGTDALVLIGAKLAVLAIFIVGWALYVRRAEGPEARDVNALPYKQGST